MTQKNNQINTTQLCVILLGIFIATRPILENALQAKFVSNDSIITSFIAGIINLSFALLICYIIHKNPGKSFYDIMKNFFGSVFTKIIMVILALIICFKSLLIDYQLTFLLYDAVYSDINWFLFAIPMLLIFAYISIKGIKTIARCYEVFVPFALIILVITLTISTFNANFENLLPLFSHNTSQIMKSLSYILIQSCEFIFLFTIMENVVTKNEKHYFKKIIITLIIIFIVVVLFYVLFVAVLGVLAPDVQETLIKITQYKDSSFGYFKIDIFVSVFWIPIIVLQSAFCIYSISYCFEKVFNFRRTITSVVLIFLQFITKFIPQINNYTVSTLFFDKAGFIILGFVFLLPVLLLIASFKKEKKKNE